MEASSSASRAIDGPTISALSRQCSAVMDNLLLGISESDEAEVRNSLEDARGRFKVWASNIEAHQAPGSSSSLDHRLRDAPLMRESVVSGLERLMVHAQRGAPASSSCPRFSRREARALLISENPTANGILAGIIPNRVATAGAESPGAQPEGMTETSELQESLLSIRASISHLFSVSMLIRRHRPKGCLPALVNFTPFERSPDICHVMDKFPKTKQSPWLAKRLGNATTQRRQLIHYWQVHRKRLGKRKEEEVLTPDAANSDSVVDSLASSTTALTFQKLYSERPRAVLTSATIFLSFGENEDHGRRIPDLSDMVLDGVQLAYGREFECPYCRTIQGAASRLGWK